ncbi:hypothetical protein [Caldivirga sp. UBA161]|uniref:hypothetical protein n=1 Tax=Caldivirga sp. UBA161 TaxID=1915569 RepID=UPI0025C52D0A|nr:hypothetical protein [Caldivirga sp. UBA161]
MVDVATVLSVLGSVAVIVGPLTALLWDRMNRLEDRMGRIEGAVSGLRIEVNELSRSMDNFSNTLIDVMAIKGLITQPEAAALRSLLSTVPRTRTKYYTEEDYQKLRYLIIEKPYEEYTWDDVKALKEIAEHLRLEYEETGRVELIEYRARLLVFASIAEGHLIAGIIGPNRKKNQPTEQPGQSGQANQPSKQC